METHIDRRVILCQESEFKSLYEWSLQELNADGKQVGRDQIPWIWTLSFTASELTLRDTIAIKPSYPDDPEESQMTAKQVIFAKLHPIGRGGIDWTTSYSMFGTDRTIANFQLQIIPLTDEDEQERCIAWGVVSYTAETDFHEETTGDSMGFYLIVRPETFTRYAEKIAASAVDEVVLHVGRVAGFYSEWSPSISADQIKVLTDDKEHKIEIPDNCEIDPPRLGEVLQAELHITKLGKARLKTSEDTEDRIDSKRNPAELTGGAGQTKTFGEAEDEDRIDGEEQIDVASQVQPNQRPPVDAEVASLLSSIRIAAWIIAGLLLLILVNWRL
ncbi:hypothetical protein ACFX5Q_25740 [Mesorhizobium sp. IMUNJ 23033]|uniref:hypothetical protein n=1 Tax=Mesorhizobium sp. IMUNJ 23033 TaxID=3378039 RepID=UPI00384E732C